MSQPSVFLVQPGELPAILRDHGFTLIDVHADAGNNTYYVAETNRNAETIVVKSTSRKHALFIRPRAKKRRTLTISAVINISNDAGYENAVSKTAQ
jgi:hypothetical protein